MELYKNLQFMLQFNTLFMSIFFFIIGACLGSFFNVVIFRYPIVLEQQNAEEVKGWLEEKNIPFPEKLIPLLEKFNLSFPSSHCYSCKTPLKWYHNIPILSYLFLRGKCGHCGAKISIQYPIVETLGGLTLYAAYTLFNQQGLDVFLLGSFFFIVCFALAGIDLKTKLLPDTLNYILLWVGIICLMNGIKLYDITLQDGLYGAVIGYLSLWLIAFIGKLIKGVDVMGNGDFKLLAAIGVFIGVKGALFSLFFAPIIGILTWIYLRLMKNDNPEIPYGPSLIIASIIYMFYGVEIFRMLSIH